MGRLDGECEKTLIIRKSRLYKSYSYKNKHYYLTIYYLTIFNLQSSSKRIVAERTFPPPYPLPSF